MAGHPAWCSHGFDGGMPVRILVVNAGSSSLKLRLLDPNDQVLAGTDIDPWDGTDEEPVARFVDQVGQVDAVGHRVVHGGATFTGPVRVDAPVRERIAALTELAPLHQPRALAAMDATSAVLPAVPTVACFDTAFHATMPAAAATYALPTAWRRRWGLRRYGFHGLSHAYASRRAAELVGGPRDALRVVSCHLGAGASLAAVHAGQSMDTTMGFTPLDGLVMATRSGSVDPGLVLWLVDHAGLPASTVSHGLERDSGLAGLAGLAATRQPDGPPGRARGDMRGIRAAADRGDADARLAIAVYQHRLRQQIAAMCAAMDGLNLLVFTGGVGEHDARLRQETTAGLGFLGVAVDPRRNRKAAGDTEVSAPGSPVRTVVVTAREDVEIARQTRAVVEPTERTEQTEQVGWAGWVQRGG